MLALFFQPQPPAVSNGASYNTYANRIQSCAIIYSTYNKYKTYFGASIRLCCRMISVHTAYSEIWRCLQPTAITMKGGRREWGGGAPPQEFTCEQPAHRAQQELLWMIMAVFFSNNFFLLLHLHFLLFTFSQNDITRLICIRNDVKDRNRQGGGLKGEERRVRPCSSLPGFDYLVSLLLFLGWFTDPKCGHFVSWEQDTPINRLYGAFKNSLEQWFYLYV